MKTIVDFSSAGRDLKYMGSEIPSHTAEGLDHYLIRGWAPGGFVEAMLASDYERALYTADTVNRQCFWTIAMWIREHAPKGSWGSYDAIDKWRDDFQGCRTAFAKITEQKLIWKQLKGTA